MAVREERSDQIIRSHGLKIELLILSEIDERKQDTDLSKRPLDRLSEFRHDEVECALLGRYRCTFIWRLIRTKHTKKSWHENLKKR